MNSDGSGRRPTDGITWWPNLVDTMVGGAWRRWGTAAGALLLYLLLALIILSPLASNTIPDSPAQDLANHVSGIIEARNALVEGQFPIRVAPNQNNRERYPIFQFYGNLPYTVGGLLYLTTDLNPYLVWKIVVAASLILGGLFTYRCAVAMTRRALPAIMAGAVFITAPYFLTDIHARFAYTEIVSFGLLPVVFFYIQRAFMSRKLVYILTSAIAWSCLALTHNITYLYASIFFSLYFLSFAILSTTYFWRMVRIGVGYAAGILLTAWYLVPQLTLLPSLRIGAAGGAIKDIYKVAWLTPLRILLAPTLVVPTPPAPQLLDNPYFGLQIGWPILIAVGIAGCCLFRPTRFTRHNYLMLVRLLLFFGLAFFMVWTPFDFWSYLPNILGYVQFPYRLLMFVVLWGSLIAAYSLTYAFRRRMRVGYVVAMAVVLMLYIIPYLAPHAPSTRVFLANEVNAPNMGRGGANSAYTLAPALMVKSTLFHPDINLAVWDYNIIDSAHRLFYPGIGEIPAPHPGDVLIITGLVPIEYQDHVVLTVNIENELIGRVSLKPGVFNLAFPIHTSFTKDRVQIAIQTNRYLDPIRRVEVSPSPDMLALDIGEIRIESSTWRSNSQPLIAAEGLKGKRLPDQPEIYVINIVQPSLVQLPVFFYPSVIRINDNDRTINYGNLGRLVVIQLPPGEHIVTVHFEGIVWANMLSLLGWLSILSLYIFAQTKHYIFKGRFKLDSVRCPNQHAEVGLGTTPSEHSAALRPQEWLD
jgi:hypothetical protein